MPMPSMEDLHTRLLNVSFDARARERNPIIITSSYFTNRGKAEDDDDDNDDEGYKLHKYRWYAFLIKMCFVDF